MVFKLIYLMKERLLLTALLGLVIIICLVGEHERKALYRATVWAAQMQIVFVLLDDVDAAAVKIGWEEKR